MAADNVSGRGGHRVAVIGVITVLAVLGACSGSSTGGGWSHTWTAQTIDGEHFDAADLAGDDVVLWFWAPW